MKRFSLAMMWLAVAGLMTMVSCRKPVIGFSGDGRAVTISAVTESGGGSKTAIDGHKVNWSEGDVISMNGCELTLKEGAGTTEGVFEGTVTGEAPYYVGYPAGATTHEGATLKLNIPATMTYEAGKVAVPMVAVTSSVEGGLEFHNAVNMLKLQLKGDGTDASRLTSIVLTSTTSNLNGDINVTFDGETPAFAAIADGAKKMTVSFGDGLQLTADATTEVYIPLAKINGGDLTVRFNCANGKCMEKTIKVENYAPAFNGVNNVLNVQTEVEVNAETYQSVQFCGTPGIEWSVCSLGATNGTDAESWCAYYKWAADDPVTAACGADWRLPTKNEWVNLNTNNSIYYLGSGKTDVKTGFKAPLNGFMVVKGGKNNNPLDTSVFMFLPLAGYKYYSKSVFKRTGYGTLTYYMTSNTTGSNVYGLYLDSNGTVGPTSYNDKSNYYPVRPVRVVSQ